MYRLVALSLTLAACGDSGGIDALLNNNDNGNGNGNGGGGTVIDSDVTSDTVWSGTLTIDGTVDIRAGVEVEAGTRIELTADSAIIVEDGGYFSCNGTASEPVTITGATGTPGFWETLRFTTNDPNNQLLYCNISYGGSGSSFGNSGNETATVIVDGDAQLLMNFSSISFSLGDGISVREGAGLIFQNNNLFSNGESPVRIFANEVGQLNSTTTYDPNNGDAYIEVLGADIDRTQVWTELTVPYLIDGIVSVDMGGTDVLTIDEGAILVMGADAGIEVLAGAMEWTGTSMRPIVVRGEVATPGYWQAIVYRSNNPRNAMDNVRISHGGSGASFGFVFNYETSVWVTDTAQHSLVRTTITDSLDSGLRVENDGEISVANGCVFNSNGGPGVRVHPRHLVSLSDMNPYGGEMGSENGDPWIDVITNDAIDTSGSWAVTSAPIHINGTPTVSPGVEIDVVQGATLIMAADAGISVDGRLSFNGTPGIPVTITGEVATPGYWQAIVYEANTMNSITYTTIEYGGSGASFGFSGLQNAELIVRQNGNLSLTNSTIRNSEEIGLLLDGSATISPSDPLISNMFSGNTTNVSDLR